MAASKKCPDCGSAKVTDRSLAEVKNFRCGHCGQEWQERDGKVEHKTYPEPPDA